MNGYIYNRYNLKNKVAIITGGGGLLGKMHAEAIAEAGGIPVIVDINKNASDKVSKFLKEKLGADSLSVKTDITKKDQLIELRRKILKKYSKIDILINNAANNPKVKKKGLIQERFEKFTLDMWYKDIAVGLTGAFLCSQIFGETMAKNGSGVILNISSDLGIIAPDQRIYTKKGVPEEKQPVKPVTYSVIKHGLIGLTRYMATYWCNKGIRVNALCPGGIYNNQPEEFVKKLTNLIPMGRMAEPDDYKGAVQFLCSDASSYMTGSVVVIDGGRTCW